MRNLAKLAYVAVLLVVAFAAGVELSAYRAGDLIVMRDQSDQCVAVDISKGARVGTFQPRDGRCHLADWRVWHPLYGISSEETSS